MSFFDPSHTPRSWSNINCCLPIYLSTLSISPDDFSNIFHAHPSPLDSRASKTTPETTHHSNREPPPPPPLRPHRAARTSHLLLYQRNYSRYTGHLTSLLLQAFWACCSLSLDDLFTMFSCTNQPRGCRGRCDVAGGKCTECKVCSTDPPPPPRRVSLSQH